MTAINIVTRFTEFFSYDDVTGDLRWKKSPSIGVSAGGVAGTLHPSGYVMVKLFGRQYGAHRIAWAITHGLLPDGHIDHINRNRRDNRICNLRVTDHQGNSQNRNRRAGNSGFPGVTRTRKGWQARLCTSGASKSLGVFNSAEAAHEAYMEAKLREHPMYCYATTDDGQVCNIAGYAECVRVAEGGA